MYTYIYTYIYTYTYAYIHTYIYISHDANLLHDFDGHEGITSSVLHLLVAERS